VNLELLSGFLLLSVPGLPLLLAFPALHSRLSWPRHIALLPAVILLAVPEDVSIELPWLLLGTGLGIGGTSRLLLAMSVVLWTASATRLHASVDQPADKRFTVFFLLTMAGNLGAVLATDLVGFFTFSTLMGLGFYGLLVDDESEAARRAGRVYLGFMILGDLLLFEALLIAAAATKDMGFAIVHHTIAQSASSGLYLFMVLVGFAAKAGVWPLHYWLPLAFRSSRPAVAILLGGVPVAIGLLGMVRWLPLGEITSPDLALIIQGLGIIAMLYAILAGIKRAQLNLLPVYIAIIATGLFTIAMGTALGNPAVWIEYGNLAPLFSVSLGIGLAMLVTAVRWLEASDHYPSAPATRADDLSNWCKHWTGAIVNWVGQMGSEALPRLQASWLILAWQSVLDRSESFLRRWTVSITLFLLLGIVLAFVGVSSWG